MFLARGASYGFFVFSILPLFFFTARIGGGGCGQVQYGGASSEFAAQSGLSQVAASAGGYSGRNIHVGVADSGVDGRHSEFSGRIHAGGDWQRARCVERVVIRAI